MMLSMYHNFSQGPITRTHMDQRTWTTVTRPVICLTLASPMWLTGRNTKSSKVASSKRKAPEAGALGLALGLIGGVLGNPWSRKNPIVGVQKH